MSSRKKQTIDLQRLSAYRHAWYLLIWAAYLAAFYLVEHLIVDDYWVSYLPLDDKIPFCRFFILPYCMWHPLLALMTAYLFFCDVPAFKRYMCALGLGFGIAIIVCIVFPNGQELRPAEFAQNDVFTWLIGCVYAADTNTNVIPSMHVIGCAALTFASFDSARLRRRRAQVIMTPLGVLISVSTVFVKQHSVLDVLAALPVCAVMWLAVYWPLRRSARKTDRKDQ